MFTFLGYLSVNQTKREDDKTLGELVLSASGPHLLDKLTTTLWQSCHTSTLNLHVRKDYKLQKTSLHCLWPESNIGYLILRITPRDMPLQIISKRGVIPPGT